MNEYDPMKENSTSNDAYASSADGRHDGSEYANPDGSYGFIYNSRESAAETRSRRYRGTLIAVSAVLVTLLLTAGCFFGAYTAVRSLRTDEEGKIPSGEQASGVGTSDGLFISDETGKEGPDQLESSSTSKPNSNGSQNVMGESSKAETAPSSTTIHKLPPKRTDENGDGKPDFAYDENGEVLTSAGKNAVSVATVVSRVSASVVEITTETIVQSGYIGQYITSGAGSGVIISEDGFIVTNHHVINNANTITVRMSDGTEFPALLIGTDEQTDVAVLWIDAGQYDLTVATLGASYDLVVGEDILAIGNPLGSLGGTVTEGAISATARQISVSGTDMTLLQISAPINPGNSGGGLFNLAGELVGVVNAKMSSEEIEGLGFAIPIDTAYDVILELIAHGYVRGRPDLGFTVVDVTDYRTAMRYFNSFNTGVYVYDNDHDMVKYGDLILAADGKEITSSSTLQSIVRQKAVGDTIELTVYREKKQITVTVTVRENVPEVTEPAA